MAVGGGGGGWGLCIGEIHACRLKYSCRSIPLSLNTKRASSQCHPTGSMSSSLAELVKSFQVHPLTLIVGGLEAGTMRRKMRGRERVRGVPSIDHISTKLKTLSAYSVTDSESISYSPLLCSRHVHLRCEGGRRCVGSWSWD